MPRSNKILIRSGTVAPSASDFVVGEPAFDKTAGKFYLKNAAGSMVEIGGSGGGTTELVYTYATTADLPGTGDATKLYVTTDTGRVYRWVDSTTKYVELGPIGGGDTTLWNLFLPPAPTNVTGTTADSQSVVSWTAPTVSAQTPINDYVVQWSTSPYSSWTTFSDGTSTATSATVTGLTNGTGYKFRVAAVNAIGTGSYSSASAVVTPAVSDAYWSSVRGLFHFDNSATDTSGTGGSWTGGAYSTNAKFGTHSLSPSSSSLSRSYASAYNFGTGDFTIEAWIYPTSSSGIYGIYATSGGSGAYAKFVVHLDSLVPKVHLNNLTNKTNEWISAGTAVTVNAWTHIAIVRASGTWSWYLGGTRTATGSESASITFSSESTYIGYGGESYFGNFAGQIDDLRLTAAARYSGASLTVPTVAFPDS